MAAKLKKRALAEFSHVIQEEPKPVQKRLRLTHQPKPPAEEPFSLRGCTTPQEALLSLLKLQESLPVSSEEVRLVLPQLIEHFYQEKDATVKSNIAAAIGELTQAPGCDVTSVLEEVKNMLKNEKSHKVKAQLIAVLLKIGSLLHHNTKIVSQILEIAKQYLKDSSHLVRCKCLDVIGGIGSPEADTGTLGQSDIRKMSQDLLIACTQDADPRVRSSAFRAMLQWHQRGQKLEQSMYSQASTSLTDDFEGVRVSAIKLVWVLCQLYPESPVKISSESDEHIRLVDDGFAKICNMVNDISLKVRAEAASLLGSLHAVSPRFLEQTLDKKLMSNMRRKRSAHERQRDHYERGEWATGQKWADDAPKEDVDPNAVNVMSSGACGAFVHGLEDEFLEVRSAAIDSLCELATQSYVFANLSQDFLVDMFNDEIESVRLNAINSLRKIGHHLVLREDQLEIILGVLKDFNFEIRESMREMFSSVRLSTKTCLNACVLALLDNMSRYPQDRPSIWRCMQNIGKKHPALTLTLVPELLSCHPYFESLEPDLEDPAYIGIMLLVFNAAVDCPTMLVTFPDHTVRHYGYLRDMLPELVPQLQLEQLGSPRAVCTEVSRAVSPTSFLNQTLTRLEGVGTMDEKAVQQLLEIGIRDLHRVGEIEPHLAGTAQCQELYLQCQLLILKLLSCTLKGSITFGAIQHNTMGNMDKVIGLSHKMEKAFLGLATSDIGKIKQLRLRAQALQLYAVLRAGRPGCKAACVHFLQILNNLQRMFAANDIKADPFTQSMLIEMHKLETCEPNIYDPILHTALSIHRPEILKLSNLVQHVRATVVEPTGTSENPIKFIAGLAAAVDVIALLENVEKLQNICIQVKYPDHEMQLITPKPSDFRQLGPLRHRLVTQVLLSHSKWSESCHVELCLAIKYKPEQIILAASPSSGHDKNSTDSKQPSLIQLCKPVKVLVSPIAEKKS